MKKVVFVDMSKRDFDNRGASLQKTQEMFLPDEYDLFRWYQEQDDIIAIERWWGNKDTFYYLRQHPDYSTEMCVVCVLDVEQLEHNDGIDGKDE